MANSWITLHIVRDAYASAMRDTRPNRRTDPLARTCAWRTVNEKIIAWSIATDLADGRTPHADEIQLFDRIRTRADKLSAQYYEQEKREQTRADIR